VRERMPDGSIKKYNYDPMISGVIKQGPARSLPTGLPAGLPQQPQEQQGEEQAVLHRPSYPGNGAGMPAVSAGSSSGRSTFSKASLYGSDEGEEGGQRKQRKSAGGPRRLGTAGSS
jgi:hypothetical protein